SRTPNRGLRPPVQTRLPWDTAGRRCGWNAARPQSRRAVSLRMRTQARPFCFPSLFGVCSVSWPLSEKVCAFSFCFEAPTVPGLSTFPESIASEGLSRDDVRGHPDRSIMGIRRGQRSGGVARRAALGLNCMRGPFHAGRRCHEEGQDAQTNPLDDRTSHPYGQFVSADGFRLAELAGLSSCPNHDAFRLGPSWPAQVRDLARSIPFSVLVRAPAIGL